MNKDHLRIFVSDSANNFLVTFFAESVGLDKTKPQCQIESLRSLLYFGEHYS